MSERLFTNDTKLFVQSSIQVRLNCLYEYTVRTKVLVRKAEVRGLAALMFEVSVLMANNFTYLEA